MVAWMSLRAYDPNARGLRKFVLLVIFAITLPSMMLTGFGLIAIQNERHATLKRVKDLYTPITGKLEQKVQGYFVQLLEKSSQSLDHLAAWATREVSFCEDRLEGLKYQGSWIATNFFVMHAHEGVLLPRMGHADPTWYGFLPESFDRALKMEFLDNHPAGAVEIHQSLLRNTSGASPLRCMVLNALGRCLSKTNNKKEAKEILDVLIDDCADFVDASGYNLALGALLRRIQLENPKATEQMLALGLKLSQYLSKPNIQASFDQIQLVIEESRKVLESTDRKALASVFHWLESLSARRDILNHLRGRIQDVQASVTTKVFRINGVRRLFLVKKIVDHQEVELLAGCELIPAGLDKMVADLLEHMEVEGVVGHLRPSELEFDQAELVAGVAFLKNTDFAWRLDVDLVDNEALERLSGSRITMYVWILVLLILALALGIGKTVHFMIRETRLSKLKTDFVSSVSHELRTPLTSIRMFTETLLLGRVESREEMRECLETIGHETERLSRLVERILDFSRMEAGRKAFRFQPERLDEIVRTAVAACRPMIEKDSFAVSTIFDDRLSHVWVDRDAMVEVVVNLLSNAIKYSTDRREVEIKTQQNEQWIVLSVRDQGIGIPKTEQKKIFEKFHRVDTPLSSAVSGSGLGLSLVDYIVRAHQGEVKVISTPGSGSTFMVCLPHRHDDADSKHGEEA